MTLEMLKQDYRKDGLREGRDEGRAEKTIEVVANMIRQGISDIAVIANIAGISMDEVLDIKQKHGL